MRKDRRFALICFDGPARKAWLFSKTVSNISYAANCTYFFDDSMWDDFGL